MYVGSVRKNGVIDFVPAYDPLMEFLPEITLPGAELDDKYRPANKNCSILSSASR